VDLRRISAITRSILRLSPEKMNKLANLCLKLSDPSDLTAERLQRELHVSTSDAIGMARELSRDRDAGILRIIAVVAAASAENAQARESLQQNTLPAEGALANDREEHFSDGV